MMVSDLFLSAILSCLSISACASQYTTTYYVTPNASTASCPHDPCYEFMTYYQNFTFYFQSNVQFIFLPGVHMFDLRGLLSVKDKVSISLVGSDNLTQHTVAEKVKDYDFDPYDEDNTITYFQSLTIIKCSNQSGFEFSNISNLCLANLSIVGCGQYSSLTSFTAAVHMFTIAQLSMEGVSIQNSTGYGLVGANLLEHSQIMRSSFIANNQYVKNMLQKVNIEKLQCNNKTNLYTAYVNNGSVDSRSIYGGNLFLWNSVATGRLELKLSDLLFALGVDGSFKYILSDDCSGHGTGLGIDFEQKEPFFLSAEIVDSTFYRNQAYCGSNIQLVVSGSNGIQMKNIHIIRGMAMAGGSGMHVSISEDSSANVSLLVADSTFECNHVENPSRLGSSICIVYTVFSLSNTTLGVLVENSTFRCDSGFSSLSFANTLEYLPSDGLDNIFVHIINSVFSNIKATDYSIYVSSGTADQQNFFLSQSVVKDSSDIIFLYTDANIINCTLENSKMTSVNSTITLRGLNVFCNCPSYGIGGAVYLFSSVVVIAASSHVMFINNSALYGGAIFMDSLSILVYESPCNVSFIGNEAFLAGGAIYVQTPSEPSQPLSTPPVCFFRVTDSYDDPSSSKISVRLYFENNHARDAGSVLYGGDIDGCVMDCSMLPYTFQTRCSSNSVFDAIVKYGNSNDIPLISSEPTLVCPCDGCSSAMSFNYSIYPGQVIDMPFVTVGQKHSVAPSVVVLYTILPTVQVNSVLRTGRGCISYPITIDPFNQTLMITAASLLIQNAPTRNLYSIKILVTVLPCPPGFVLAANSCICNALLSNRGFTCYISNQTVQAKSNQWVGYISQGNALAVSDQCPFDYCSSEEIINVTDFNSQCNYHRADVLCGQCQEGLSMTFGTSQCKMCSHYYLFLVIPFALMGLALVVLLFVLNLTVSAGTINGMILYANIFRINDTIFFPGKERSLLVKFLSTFIAWFNLDVGIETCFYDGMNSYVKTWLQFVFPIYLFTLILIIIIVGRYSSRISKLCRYNVVPVLATLILLSYSKILRITIIIFSYSPLETESSTDSQLVWLYDGNVKLFGPEHTALFLFGLTVFTLFISPYTLLLLMAPCFQAWSNWKCFHWINRIKPFIDCYNAPFKDKYRFWSGMLLLGRLPLYLLFALENDPKFKLWGILIFTYLYSTTTAMFSVYKNWFLLVLEMLFIMNMAAVTAALLLSFNTSGTIGATVFLLSVCGVVIFHIFHQCKRLPRLWLTAKVPTNESKPFARDIINNPYRKVGHVYRSTEQLRESLLEDN